MSRYTLSTTAALVALAALPNLAEANVAAASRSPATVSPPGALSQTPLEVESEHLKIACVEEDYAPVCTFEATYRIHNPSAELVETVSAFYGSRIAEVEVEIDGEAAGEILDASQTRYLDSTLPFDPYEGVRLWLPPIGSPPARAFEDVERRGAVFRVDANATRSLVARGKMLPGSQTRPGYGFPAVVARHLALSNHRPARRWDVDYLLAPIKTWASVGPVSIEISHPSGWSFEPGFFSISSPDPQSRTSEATRDEITPGWTHERGSETSTARVSVPPGKLSDVLTMTFGVDGAAVNNGGVLVGIGGTTGDKGGFRMRAGYALSGPDWLLYSVSADTDFDKVLSVTPTVALASPMVLIMPSFGLGVGVPVLISPQTQVGIRGQLDAHLGPLGFVMSLDVFPGVKNDSEEDQWQLTLLGQVSL